METEELGITEARKVLGDLVNQVYHRNEAIVLTHHGKPTAGLISFRALRLFETLLDDCGLTVEGSRDLSER